MSTSAQPNPTDISEVPLRDDDGNGSKAGDSKLYVLGEDPSAKQSRCPKYYKIWLGLLLLLFVVAIGILVWYFTESSSSSSTDTVEAEANQLEVEDIDEDLDLLDRSQYNVMLIVTDDGGWGDFGAYAVESRFTAVQTPKIDDFMEQSLTFKNFHSQPICTPARGSLFTGRWTWAIGMQVFNVLSDCTNGHLPEDIPTWAELLADRGYMNHFIGKWNIGCDSWLATPLGRGFDTFLGALNHPEGLDRGGGGDWSSISGYCTGTAETSQITDVFEKCLANCFSYAYATYDDDMKLCRCFTEAECPQDAPIWPKSEALFDTINGAADGELDIIDEAVGELQSTTNTVNEDASYSLYEWKSQISKSVDWWDNTDGGDPLVGSEADDLVLVRATEWMKELAAQDDADAPWTMTITFATPHASLAYLPNGTMEAIKPGCDQYFNEGVPTYNYNRGVICQQMADLDERVEALLVNLKALDLWDNTLVIFVNDNGADPGQIESLSMPNYGLNWPLRGGKFTWWEGGIRTILSIGGGALPEQYRQKENFEMHDIIDVAATILAAGGFSNQELSDNNIDGVPLIDIGSAHTGKHEILYHSMPMFREEHVNSNTSAITWDGMKYVGRNAYISYELGGWSTLPTANSLLSNIQDGSGCSDFGCLYDLTTDPYEMTDLSNDRSDLMAAFQELVDEVIVDPDFNKGIEYSDETELCGVESSFTHIHFGNRSYFYNFPWLDTSDVLYDRRRLQEQRRESFRERKRRRRRMLMQEEK